MTVWSQRFYRVSIPNHACTADGNPFSAMLTSIFVVELLLRYRNVLRYVLHPLRMETRLVGNRRQNFRISGSLRDPSLPLAPILTSHRPRNPAHQFIQILNLTLPLLPNVLLFQIQHNLHRPIIFHNLGVPFGEISGIGPNGVVARSYVDEAEDPFKGIVVEEGFEGDELVAGAEVQLSQLVCQTYICRMRTYREERARRGEGDSHN